MKDAAALNMAQTMRLQTEQIDDFKAQLTEKDTLLNAMRNNEQEFLTGFQTIIRDLQEMQNRLLITWIAFSYLLVHSYASEI